MTTGRQVAQSECWVGDPEWVRGRWPRVGMGQVAQSEYGPEWVRDRQPGGGAGQAAQSECGAAHRTGSGGWLRRQ